MKRTVISVLTVAALLVALSGAALATTTAIVNGTAAGDYIKGTARADTIHGRGGDDAIRQKVATMESIAKSTAIMRFAEDGKHNEPPAYSGAQSAADQRLQLSYRVYHTC